MKKLILYLFILFIFQLAGSRVFADAVEGLVLDGNKPVPKAKVYIGDNTAITDHNGFFVMWLDPGVYRIIRVENYRVQGPKSVPVPSGKKVNITIRVRP